MMFFAILLIIAVVCIATFRGLSQSVDETRRIDAEMDRIVSRTPPADNHRTESPNLSSNSSEMATTPQFNTRQLMIDTLRAIGCQPTSNPDETIDVAYQGENFRMDFGGAYAHIWDPGWTAVRADDPNLPKIREAINAANYKFEIGRAHV